MKLIWVLLIAGCIGAGDENNCSALTCGGCCAVDGTCHEGTENAACGEKGAACVDCTRNRQVCGAAVCR